MKTMLKSLPVMVTVAFLPSVGHATILPQSAPAPALDADAERFGVLNSLPSDPSIYINGTYEILVKPHFRSLEVLWARI
ncbi:hypothetical protein KDD30_15715 [Photobacterium sp. GJ3]|uniref:hypothetical protein n=1 Tax=Photobacterium sp. GJ3 TaxID=2829502 RepID=UPI001B8C177B|nr:hypothetical protein [Photobacterium sp. GJ3]QUJ67453.1 hypothetical protein KDD30_15715 [Photobacterium sp. GJ3]